MHSVHSEDMSSPEKGGSGGAILVPSLGVAHSPIPALGSQGLQQLQQQQIVQPPHQVLLQQQQQQQQQPHTPLLSGRVTPADRKRKRKSVSATASLQHTQVT